MDLVQHNGLTVEYITHIVPTHNRECIIVALIMM